MDIKKYNTNSFILLLPIFIWNILLIDHLPIAFAEPIFTHRIPSVLLYSENITRIIVFILPLFMQFSSRSRGQKIGFSLYIGGVVIYFSSWIALIIAPNTWWSNSHVGFMAPAYSTLIWFIGIGMVDKKRFPKSKIINQSYIIVSTVFVILHTIHCYLVIQQLQ